MGEDDNVLDEATTGVFDRRKPPARARSSGDDHVDPRDVRAMTSRAKKTSAIADPDHDGGLALRVAAEVLRLLNTHGKLIGADLSRRRKKKEAEQWRSENEANGFLDPTRTEEDSSGESLWSAREAKELVAITRAKKKQEK